MLNHALKYAGMGWPVFPLAPRSKVPIAGTNGFQDATTDEKLIGEWWRRWPEANIGLATGVAFTVIDIDLKPDKDIDGHQSLKELEKIHGAIPETITSLTGSGGTHYLFNPVKGMRLSAGVIGPGIDTRGEGGYIVAPPSTHDKTGKPYTWAIDYEPGDLNLADMPDWLKLGNLSGFDPDKHKAKATGEPVGVGRRNDSLASLAGQWVSDGLTLLDIAAKANEWNGTLEAPMTPAEVDQTVRSIVTTHEKNHPTAVVLEKPPESIISTRAPSRMPDDLLRPPGYIGELVDWIVRTAHMPQPEMALANALAFFGTVTGRKICTETDLRTNLYCLGVADSGAGKDHSRQAIKKLCIAGGMLEEVVGGEDVSSDVAMLTAVAKRKSVLFQLDEIGHMLSAANSDKAAHYVRAIPVILTKLFSSAESTFMGKEYADQTARPREDIDQPNVCLYGTSVPSRFYDGITSNEIRDGFLGRILVFRAHNSDPDPQRVVISEVPKDLIQVPQAWLQRTIDQGGGNLSDLHNKPLIVPTQAKALDVFNDFYATCRRKKNEARDADTMGMDVLWSRAAEHAQKIALTVSAGCELASPVIDRTLAEYATNLVDFLIMDLEVQVGGNVSDTQYGRDKLKLLGWIKTAGPDGLSATALHRKGTSFPRKVRESMVQDLIDEQSIYIKEIKHDGAGRPSKLFIALL